MEKNTIALLLANFFIRFCGEEGGSGPGRRGGVVAVSFLDLPMDYRYIQNVPNLVTQEQARTMKLY